MAGRINTREVMDGLIMGSPALEERVTRTPLFGPGFVEATKFMRRSPPSSARAIDGLLPQETRSSLTTKTEKQKASAALIKKARVASKK